MTVESCVSHAGPVWFGRNISSVPGATRKRGVEVQSHAKEVRIFEEGALIAAHPLLEDRSQRRIDPARRRAPPVPPEPHSASVGRRTPASYDASESKPIAA